MVTFDAIELFLISRDAKNDDDKTIKWYRIILEYFQAEYPELPETPEKIELFLRKCKGGDERRHGFYRTLRVFYRFLHRRYHIRNVISEVDPPVRKKKLPRPLYPDDLIKLLVHPHEPNILAYLLFLSDTGVRVCELAALKPEDIIHTPFGYAAKVNVECKTGERYVPLMDSTYESVIPHLPYPYSSATLSRWIVKAFKDAGVKGGAHNLRHTFGTMWEGPESTLKTIMGHSSYEMLTRYREVRLNMMCKQHKMNSPLNILNGGNT